jgi:hypothetical protein
MTRWSALAMVGDVLDSDVLFAREMLDANHPDAEILAALRRRGVTPGKAAQLLKDLQTRPHEVRAALSAESAFLRTRLEETPGDPAKANAVRPRPRRDGAFPWWFLLIALIFSWALGYCLFHDDHPATDYEKHALPPKTFPDSEAK